MAKRKRSFSELTAPPSASSLQLRSEPHLPSRTLKRYRDGRPSEDVVHERTLGILFSAQRRGEQQQQQHLSPLNHQIDVQMGMTSPPSRDRQGTLHRYWNIATEPSSVASSPQPVMSPVECGCEDCGRCATNVDGEMPDMGGVACIVCGKMVCLACSVSNLGEDRHCLNCVGAKAWVGGCRSSTDRTLVF
ncbi:ORF21 protein [Ophiocordyceps camponoti-floridani]|uniref:ORF21 protein n=1 Tax=Ophiocordyceps camponoti-floridani TaxID=2030778 RepID=A0A8H4QAU8_9HYPO|nr:ORF21 protein [Ophiocordyceps camponoti-floridani]